MRNEDMGNLNSNAVSQDSEETIANNQDANVTPVTIRPGAIRVEADANGMVALPPEVALGDIAVVGTDLVIELPDGTQWVIVDGAIFVPQLMIGDVEVPPTNLAALLIGEEPEPAAGQNQSSGGNFSVAVPDLGPPQPLGDLLPPTALDYTPPEPDLSGQYLEPDAAPEIVIETEDNPTGAINATADVSESGLPAGPGLDGARGADESEGSSASSSSETTTGTFVYFSPDTPNVLAVDGLVVNGVVITGPGQIIEGQYGFLEIIAVRDGEIDFRYTLTDNTNGDNTSDDFSVTVTDIDGDTATATLKIAIIDDVPVARNDEDYIAPGGMQADGNVMTGAGTTTGKVGSDTEGADGAVVVDVSGEGDTNAGEGMWTVEGLYGTLTIYADGSYEYARDPLSKGGVEDVFIYTIEDGDGDQSTATLTIVIDDLGDDITIVPDPDGGDTVDESGLPAGPGVGNGRDPGEPEGTEEPTNVETATGTITWVDGDGINVIRINDVIVTGPGQEIAVDGGILTIISYDPDANVIEYRYTLTDNTSGDDTSISFTVTVTDADGDVASDTVTIKIVDDDPIANDDVVNVAPADQNDPVVVNVFANDVEGADGVELSTIKYVDGSLTGAGTLVNNGDGTFTYSPAPGEEGTVTFRYTIEDGDGDVDDALVTINLPTDDTPVAGQADALAADEDSLGGSNNDEGQMAPDPVEVDHMEALSGTVSVTFGADVPADLMDSFAFLEANEAALDAAGWTSGGNAITWEVSADGHTLTGSANGSAVIIVSLDSATLTDAATGEVTYGYSVELLDVVDHMDSDLEDTLSFDVLFNVTDSDGDMLAGDPSFSVSVYDDVHSSGQAIVSQANENAEVIIDIDAALEEGADGVDLGDVTYSVSSGNASNLSYDGNGTFTYNPDAGETGTVSFSYTIVDGDGDEIVRDVSFELTDSEPQWEVAASLSADEDSLGGSNNDEGQMAPDPVEVDAMANPTGTTSVLFGGDVPADLMDSFAFLDANEAALDAAGWTSGGNAITWEVSADGHTLTGSANGSAVIIVSLDSATLTDAATGEVTYGYSVELLDVVDHMDSDLEDTLSFDVLFNVTDSDGDMLAGDPSFSVSVYDDVHSAGEADVSQADENAPVFIDITTDLEEGADGVDLSDVTVSWGSGDQSNLSYNAVTGVFTYTPDAGETGTVSFSYTIYDGDGDAITRDVSFELTDSEVALGPVGDVTVDEDGLNAGDEAGEPDPNDDNGQLVPKEFAGAGVDQASNTIVVEFGGDVPADLMGAFSFINVGDLNGVYTQGGEDIVFSLSGDGDTIVGQVNGAGDPVITIAITGVSAPTAGGQVTYTYTVDLDGPMDQLDGNNDEGGLTFDVDFRVTENQGENPEDSAEGSFSVTVEDDVHTVGDAIIDQDMENDPVTFDITNGLVEGADGVDLSEVTYSWISGTEGNLSYDSNTGVFTYTPSNGETGPVSFSYTIYDNDGDFVTKTVEFNISDRSPQITGLDDATVDEDGLGDANDDGDDIIDNEGTELPGGENLVFQDNFQVDFFADNPGANEAEWLDAIEFTGNALTALNGYNLESGGNGITFAFLGGDTDIIVGTINGGATEVLRIEITGASAGADAGKVIYEYTVTLSQPIDHPVDLNPTEMAMVLNGIEIQVEDSDGSVDDATFSVSIYDDVPTAENDGNTELTEDAVEGGVTSTGDDDNVFDNDIDGADGGQVQNPGTQFGTYGNLTIDANGDYNYVLTQAGIDFMSTLQDGETFDEVFNYTLIDGDGDTDGATLTITLTGSNDPVEISGTLFRTVDEDDLATSTGNPAGGADGEAGGSDGSDPTTISGSITITADDGVLNLSIGGVALVVNGVVQAPAGAQVTALGNSVTFTYDEANGEIDWEYTLLDNENHIDDDGGSNETNATDLVESFTINLEDTDNDMTSDSLVIRIVDDVPTAVNDGAGTPFAVAYEGSVDIDAFANDDFGADGVDIEDTVNGDNAKIDFDAVSVQGGTVTYDETTGEFTYNAPADFFGTDSFTYTITDADGDPSTATVFVDVDSAPQLDSVDNAIVDEDGLGDEAGEPDANDDQDPLQSDPAELEGTGSDESSDNEIVVDFGNDLPGNALTAFSWVSPASLNGQLTQGGVDIEFTANGAVLEGRVGGAGDPVITITVSVAGTVGGEVTYHYDVDLDGPVDHPDGDDTEAIAGTILSNVQFQVTDSDGTMLDAPGTLSVSIWDDVPQITFNDLEDAGDTLETSDANLPDDSDNTLFVSDMITHNALYGADGAGAADVVSYGVQISGDYVAADGTGIFSGGDEIYLYTDGTDVWGATSNTFVASDSSEVVFTVSVDSVTGRVTLTQEAPIDHTGAEPLPLPVDLIDVTINVTIEDGDGDSVSASDSVDLGGNLLFGDDAPTSVGNTANATIALDETDLTGASISSSANFAASFDTPPDFGNDGAADNANNGITYALLISDGDDNGSDIESGLFALDPADQETATDPYGQGDPILLSMDGGDVIGTAGGVTYFRISVDNTGEVTFTQYENIWHQTAGDNDETATITLNAGTSIADKLLLQQTLTDFDGDASQSTVSLSDAFSIDDDGPSAFDPEDAPSIENDGDGTFTGALNDANDDMIGEAFVGTDGVGDAVFINNAADNLLRGTDNAVLTSGGDDIYLFGFGTDELVASTDSTNSDAGLVVFTMTLDEGSGSGADASYSIVFERTIDDGSGSQFDDLGISSPSKYDWLGVSGKSDAQGNPIDFGVDDDSRDVLITAPGATLNVASGNLVDNVGSGNQWVDPNEDIRVDWVIDIAFDPGADFKTVDGYTFEEHFEVVDGKFTIVDIKTNSGATASVLIEAFDDPDTGDKDVLGGTPVALDASSVVVTDQNDNDVTNQVSIYQVGDNIIVTGLDELWTVSFESQGGAAFNAFTVENASGDALPGGGTASGEPFSIGGFGYEVIAEGSNVEFDVDVRVNDADGDTVDGDITITLHPDDGNPLNMVEKIALDAANDDMVMAELNQSQSLMMSSALALGFAATLPAKFSWGDAGIAEATVMDLAAYDVPSFTGGFGALEGTGSVSAFEGAAIGGSDAVAGQSTFVAAKEAFDVSLDAIELPVEAPSAPKADTAALAVADKVAIVDAGDVIMPGAEALAAMVANDAGSVDLALVAKEALVEVDGGDVDALLAQFDGGDAGAPEAVATLMVVSQEAIGFETGGYLSANMDALLTDAAIMHQDAAIAVVNG